MEKKTDIDLSAFSTGNEILILATLNKIKEQGSLDHLAPIIDLIANTQSENIKNSATSLLKDVKSTETKQYLLALLEQTLNIAAIRTIVNLCWEINLDMSDNLLLFSKILVENDLETAIEAYTVITENAPNTTEKHAKECIQFLKEKESEIKDAREGLLSECIAALEAFHNQS